MATLNISTTENTNEISNNDTLNENPTENQTEIRSEIPDSDQPTKKKGKEKIPLSVKNTLWSLHFQNSLNGVCQCCKTENISKNNFDCGHVKSEKEGGAVELSNLKPICRACNSSMGTLNMETFMKKYGFDKIPELKTESEKKVEVKVKEVDKEVEKTKEVKVKEKKDDKEEKLRREKEEKIKEDKIKEEERIKEEEKFMKETEKLEKQMKDANDKAIKFLLLLLLYLYNNFINF
jgi:5-methylcytosine-specific restriction endonuclease McrA